MSLYVVCVIILFSYQLGETSVLPEWILMRGTGKIPDKVSKFFVTTKMTKEINTFKEKLDNALRELEIMKKKTIKHSVGFTVTTDQAKLATQSGIIPFSRIINSYGGGFNTSDGVFYCPQAGLYQFSSTIANTAFGPWFEYKKNGQTIGRLYKGEHSGWGIASASVVVRLQRGDKVWIQLRKGSKTQVHRDISLFSGILVSF